MKVDYTVTPEERVNLLKIAIAELSAYWKSRAQDLERPMSDGSKPHEMAQYAAVELKDCAHQLDRILNGKPTDADGFKDDSAEPWQNRGGEKEMSKEKYKEPSGVVVKKTCEAWGKPDCLPQCNGECNKDGIISRELSKDEAVEMFLQMFRSSPGLHWQYIEGTLGKRRLILPSGERLELKEGV